MYTCGLENKEQNSMQVHDRSNSTPVHLQQLLMRLVLMTSS
jgi:hypothetical protein